MQLIDNIVLRYSREGENPSHEISERKKAAE
jgi:hypothetical protein